MGKKLLKELLEGAVKKLDADDLAKAAAKQADEVAQTAARNADSLDMTTAARMARAREQGFDTDRVGLHGSDRGGDTGLEYVGHFGSRNPNDDGYLGSGFYTFDKNASGKHGGEYASFYALRNPGGKDGAVYPVITKGNYLQLDGSELGFKGADTRQSSVRKALGLHHKATGQEVADAAKAAGYDGVEYAIPDSPYFPGGSVERVTFDPANIRSINAAFDPANIGKNDLLGASTVGGMATAGVLGGAALAAQNIYGDSDRVRQVYDDFRNRRGQKAPFWDYMKKGGTVGEVADYAINLGAALIAPIVEAPWTLADYVSGVPAGQMAERRQQRRAQADYEPRTEAAQGWSDAAMGALGQGLAAPIHALDVVTEPIQPLAKKAWGAIGDREKMALEAGLDLIP